MFRDRPGDGAVSVMFGRERCLAGPEATTTDALKQAQSHIYAGRFADALAALEPVFEAEPDHVDARYAAAVAARYLDRADEAQDHIDRIKRVAPGFGRAHQEEGHLHRSLGEAGRALSAYRRAVRANPALDASWRAIAELAETRGRTGEATHARAQAAQIAKLPKPLIAATHLFHDGKVQKAEQAVRAFLQQNPRHVEAMRLLARIGMRFGVMEDAEFLLESALAFEPENDAARIEYVQVLRKRQKFATALNQAEALYTRDPNNPTFRSQYAIELMQTGDYDGALTHFEAVLERVPDDPATLTSRGHALKTAGRSEEAIESYRAACRARPDHGDAWYALANLKTYVFSEAEMAEMKRAEQSPDIGPDDRIHFCFALGKAHEDAKDYAASFEYYERGNALKKAQTRYTSEGMEAELAAQAEVCTPALFSAQGGKGCPAPDPIFIVGLPRAGSTLLEQILASHSQVDGTLELPNILAISHGLRGRKRVTETSRYPAVLHDLSGEDLAKLGERYIEETRIHRKGAPFFTDKMPNNFRHIGLIKLILPNAKIIDARRHPMASCFSGFKQLFAEGQEFTYGLDEVGRYYRAYVELMDHWDSVLPGEILRVIYEDVVEDLESQVRRILEFCGLPFERACIDFHQTKREVRTASSEQVRQPLFKSGLEQWRAYEPWLDPLKDALGPALDHWRGGLAAQAAE